MSDLDEDFERFMPSKRKVEELRNKLLRLPGRPLAEVSRIVRGFWGRDPRDLIAMDGAFLSVLDDQKRSELAELSLGSMDIYTGAGSEKYSPTCLVAIGVLCEGGTPVSSGKELRELFCDEESVLRLDMEDPFRPDIAPFILAAPIFDFHCSAQLMYTMALHLGDDAVPGATAENESWVQAFEQTGCANVLYMFAIDARNCERAVQEWSFSGAYYEQCVSRIQARVDQINKEHPQARAKMLPARRFSRAIKPLQEAALAVSIREYLRDWRESFKEFASQAFEGNEQPQLSERGGLMFFDSALLSTTIWEEEMTQTVDILLTSPERPEVPAIFKRERISVFSTIASLESVLKDVCTAEGLRIVRRSNLKSPAPWEPSEDESVFYDVAEHWLPRKMTTLPNGSRALIKSAQWLKTLGPETDEDFEEMRRWPYPFLYKGIDISKLLQAHFVPELVTHISNLCNQPGLCYEEACEAIVEKFPGYLSLLDERVESLHQAVPYEMYLSHHFCKCDGRVFHIKQSLVERLDFTDIEEGIPVAYLRAPFTDCYFHLETPMVLEEGLHLGSEARVVGYFVTQKDRGQQGWRLAIALVVTVGDDMLTALGQEVVLDLTPDDPRGLLQALNDLLADRHRGKRLSLKDKPYQILNMCAKILLYLGMRNARLANRLEKTRLLERAKESGRPASERKRDLHRAAKLYDYIEVGPDKSMAQEHTDLTHERGKVFWRRGFFRMQAYGPKWTKHRQQWIQPTLVNSDMLSETEACPSVRDYRVGGRGKG